MNLPDTLRRVSRSRPCAICKKPDWCAYSLDGTEAVCCRIQSEHYSAKLNGWIHRIGVTEPTGTRLMSEPWYAPSPPQEMARLHEKYQMELGDELLDRIANNLGVSEAALGSIGIGYSKRHKAFTFPMHDGAGRVCGIRLRNFKGEKWAVSGSRNGLFMPDMHDPENPIVVCEGPTDTAAMIDIGFDAIGRSSCRGDTELVVSIAARHHRDFIIIADSDGPGRDGARELARALVAEARSVKVIQPLRGKDARQWVNHGATRKVVLSVAASVEPYRSGKKVVA